MAEYEESIPNCDECGTPIAPPKRFYCSRECALRAAQRRYREKDIVAYRAKSRANWHRWNQRMKEKYPKASQGKREYND